MSNSSGLDDFCQKIVLDLLARRTIERWLNREPPDIDSLYYQVRQEIANCHCANTLSDSEEIQLIEGMLQFLDAFITKNTGT
ncbi:hypothetical protein AM571_PA00353 (plasmid) [Rhizobium etli 8C-3]|uniref:Uncharacterized protein n=1 Tax=Rhizobium etli 8C-3 TaxID=538025 RepID=A0A1L5PAU8_RHIET|nr:hypothetical protein [Rhizobium etli]APO77233.1 hypothetical protein AM571_PA00353 [Rhizobium etli 8C-3]